MVAVLMAAVLSAGGVAAQTPPPPADPLAVKPIPSGAHVLESAVIRTRIEQAGYTDISGLVRDTAGVWRGTARKGDEAVDIVVDKGGRIKAARR
jgi:hypothetical protein